jgi:hypothetical protein
VLTVPVAVKGPTTIISVALPVPPALVALIVALYIAAVVGVPEINPAFPPFAFTVKPGGNPLAP